MGEAHHQYRQAPMPLVIPSMSPPLPVEAHRILHQSIYCVYENKDPTPSLIHKTRRMKDLMFEDGGNKNSEQLRAQLCCD